MDRIPGGDVDRLGVTFDEGSLVSDAGLLIVGTLMKRWGVEQLVDRTVRLGTRPGGANPGRKVLSLVASMLAGGSHIDHADRLRAGSTHRVLPFRVMAPSTLGTFLRSFTWGHVRQLEKALTMVLEVAWTQGAGPGDGPLTLDLDSTICEVSGKSKEGASYGYTKVLGYHPLVATRADTAEIVGARLREGSSQRGVAHFTRETIRRVRRAGAFGKITVRADSGFCSYEVFDTLESLGVSWSITVPLWPNVRRAVARIDENDWKRIDYPPDGVAQVAETTVWVTNRTRRTEKKKLRLVVRRTRLTDPHQAQLWPDWRYHAFVTNRDQEAMETDQHHHDRDTGGNAGLSPVEADLYHRRHAVCELSIRDLKQSAGLAHLPSGRFCANAAWLACAALAHNLYRWVNLLSNAPPHRRLTTGQTIRTRLFAIPGRLVNHSGRYILRLPARWPWAHTYLTTLTSIRCLPQLC